MTTIRLTAAVAVLALMSTTTHAQGLLPWGNNTQNSIAPNGCCGPNGCAVPNGNNGYVPQNVHGTYPGTLPHTTNRPQYNNGQAPYFNDQYRNQDWRPQGGVGQHNPGNHNFNNIPHTQHPGQFPNQGRGQDLRQPSNGPFNYNQNRQPLPGNPMFTGLINNIRTAPAAQPALSNGWFLN